MKRSFGIMLISLGWICAEVQAEILPEELSKVLLCTAEVQPRCVAVDDVEVSIFSQGGEIRWSGPKIDLNSEGGVVAGECIGCLKPLVEFTTRPNRSSFDHNRYALSILEMYDEDFAPTVETTIRREFGVLDWANRRLGLFHINDRVFGRLVTRQVLEPQGWNTILNNWKLSYDVTYAVGQKSVLSSFSYSDHPAFGNTP